jgi:osmotically-inducible protein OsmY
VRFDERVWGVATVTGALTVRRPAASNGDDQDIERIARQLLDWSVTVPAGMVTVTVHDQVVTLAGTVTWAFQSDAAARAVSDLRGVRAVRNRIALRVAS